jgi:thioredoxin-like negative regulator of GroEL
VKKTFRDQILLFLQRCIKLAKAIVDIAELVAMAKTQEEATEVVDMLHLKLREDTSTTLTHNMGAIKVAEVVGEAISKSVPTWTLQQSH